MLNELSFYTFRSISVAVRCITQSMAALVWINGGGWWQQHDVTRPKILHFVCCFFVFLCVCVHKFLCTQWSSSMHFYVFMLVSISFYTLLEQFYAVFMRQQIYFLFIELLISMQHRHQKHLAHLDHWFYEFDHPSHAIFQISNFQEDEIVFMFYACGLMFCVLFPC
jgi:hypothetical protein